RWEGHHGRRPQHRPPDLRERRLTRVRAGSKFNVKVEGGKGAVIGDFATVIQIFKEAPPALSSQMRTQEFVALIEERTRTFVGREYVFAAIDEARPRPPLQRGAAWDPVTTGVPLQRVRTADRSLRARPQEPASGGDAGRRVPRAAPHGGRRRRNAS